MSTAMALITGFCFSRLRFKGRNAIFMSLLALSILPSTITLAPTYLMYYKLGLYDTFWVYVLGGPCINVMGGFMVMLSFDKIPREIDDAAKIDGAGYPAILLKVLFPLQIPILTYLAIGTAIATWNDWFMPFYFTSSAALQTLPSALARLSTVAETAFMPNYPLVITLSLGTTIPPLFLFFFFQRYIIEGIGNIGVKG
jgi:multiple sugar transport system permease protein